MKNIFSNCKWFLIISAGLAMIIGSCEKSTDVVDSDYPDQQIYIAAARSGIFEINNLAMARGDNPTEGSTYKYRIELENNKFIVPLAVNRGGIDNSGGFMVDVNVNTDTITDLIAAGKLENTSILPAGKYTIVSSVNMDNGKEFAPFDLTVDLDFLLANAPDKKFAVGVSISSSQRASNPELNTIIVVIDTKFLIPLTSFEFFVDKSDWRNIIFKNNTLYGIDFLWDFGDGSTSSETNPSHIYPDEGEYTVKLTATGLAGEVSVTNIVRIIEKIPPYESILSDNPVAFWRFNETSGTMVADETGSHPLTLVNGPNLNVNGVAGSGIRFLMSNRTYAKATNHPDFDFTGSFTIELWMNIMDGFTGDWDQILGKGNSSYMVRRSGGSKKLRFEILGGSGGDARIECSYELEPNTWVHVAAVYDAEAGEMRMYFNGQLDPKIASRSGTMKFNSSDFVIGANFNDNGDLTYRRFFNGLIDEVAVFDYALSSEQIQSHFEP